MSEFYLVNAALVEGSGTLCVKGIDVYINEKSIAGSRPRWWVKDAIGNHLFIKTRDRLIAQQVVDSLLGKGRYAVRDGGI